MLKLLDFLYYFVYQLNRREDRGGSYDNSRFGLGFLFFCIFISFSLPLDPILEKLFEFKAPDSFWGILMALLAFGFSYYLTNKYYGKMGSRGWVIVEFDRKYNFKKQNYILQIVVLTFCLISFFVLCYVFGIRLKRYLGLWIPE